tara:strand:- start:794 stop:1210 length:417 start_codon:yes stop_codon:yes gene_type:complete
MKKHDLKQLIKPIVKECIHEVLLEEGLLSNVVAEVAKGLQGNLVVETQQKAPQRIFNEELNMKRKTQDTRTKMNEHRQKLMKAVGSDAYGGIDLFEGTQPMPATEPQAGQPDLGNPSDPGVDLSSILGNASEIWQSMK